MIFAYLFEFLSSNIVTMNATMREQGGCGSKEEGAARIVLDTHGRGRGIDELIMREYHTMWRWR